MPPKLHQGGQLALELYTQDLQQSVAFYRLIGFDFVRDSPGFAMLQWDESVFMLATDDDMPPYPATGWANLRVIVDDVDAHWDRIRGLEFEGQPIHVVREVRTGYYGMRDFIIRTPEGFALRFGMFI